MNKSRFLLLLLCFCIILSTDIFMGNAYADSFQYSGYLESDSVRSASMNLSVSGSQVTGTLTLSPVCQSNARLPGAEFSFTGTVEGKWEGGAISGSWSGAVKWCDKSESRSGNFSITSGQKSVIFSSSGSYYNRFIFNSLGKTSGPESSPSAADPPSTWAPATVTFDSPPLASLGQPGVGFQPGLPSHLKENLVGTVEMAFGETRLFAFPTYARWIRTDDRRVVQSFGSCYKTTYFAEPGSILSSLGEAGDGLNVKAVGEGIGKVYARKGGCECVYEGGDKGSCSFNVIWLAVVGEKGYREYTGKKRPESSDPAYKPDISSAKLIGRTVMVGTRKPVGNAQISLIARQGGSFYRDEWKSKSDGRFSIRADNMLVAGVYEVMAQVRYWKDEKGNVDLGTADDPFTVYKDLWPIKKYFVTISREAAASGSIDVGDIEMDTVDHIFNSGDGRSKSENRDPVKNADTRSPKTKSGGQPPASAYNPLNDPNMKSSSRKYADTSAADRLGSDFQGGYGKTSKSGGSSTQYAAPQSDSYTGNSGSRGGQGSESDSQPVYPYGGGYGSRGNNWSSSECDPSQKQSAYNAGFRCRRQADSNSGKMTRDCSHTLQTYRNMDAKSGWGQCLSVAFDSGYRDGQGHASGSHQPASKPSKQASFSAEYENKANENVHIFIDGKENFGLQNRLTPGQKRTVTLSVTSGQTIKFTAGRNGQVLANCSWQAGQSGGTVSVKFSGTSTLTCSQK